MIESHDYHVQLSGTGLKTGALSMEHLDEPSFDVASPPEFGGPAGVWSPEHLFVATLSSCLMTTYRSIADASKVDVIEYRDDAIGHLQRREDRRYWMDRVVLRPRIVVPADQIDRAVRLVDKAENACLISNSVTTEVVVEAQIVGAETLV